MSNFVGMDVAEIRDVAKRFTANSEQLRKVVRRLDELSTRASAAWHGDDAAAFRRQWSGQYRAQVQAIGSALAEMGQAAARNADDQDRTSAVDPGSGTGTAAGGGNGIGRGAGAATGSGHNGAAAGSPDSTRVPVLKMDLTDVMLVDAASSDSSTLPPGYQKVTGDGLAELGLTGYTTTGITGMDVSVYRDAGGHYVVAFPGSSVGHSSVHALWDSAMDWAVNDTYGAFVVSPQELQAIGIGRAMASHVGADNVTFAGHSLGGQNAAVAALVSGSHAVTFNAAALDAVDADFPGLRGRADELITNYGTLNDPLSNSEKYGLFNSSLGRTVLVPGTKNWMDLGGNHGTGAIEAGIRSQIDLEAQAR